ncbi:unnamed protein product [Heligmosomoides polygyrus]|uniref:Peptidase A2 domain-containing protein n=1 Tax=Heligmosomoides polygyrus TaxID=6339 RepID=A0A183GBW6_HELPZ|nr:unnamed protein product [Heligmosomoides polygyrus]
MMVEVQLLGLSRWAVLDSGSQVSIILLETLNTAHRAGFDLNADVEEAFADVPLTEMTAVYDASTQKTFKDAVRLTLQVGDSAKCKVAPLAKADGDGTLLLDANVFHALVLSLTWKSVCPRRSDHQKRVESTRDYLSGTL